jgi:3',5'-cyclic AMP phosphodiesterase CpdA
MTRVLQISDTHLSPTKAQFAPNWEPLRAWIVALRPDLVIHTGDVTVDGADVEDDLRHCAALLAALPAPTLATPGNHDVGEAGHPHQPVNSQRIAQWRRHFGPDWWRRDVENWRLIGFNSMLASSDLPDEAEQLDWLSRTMAEAGGRRIAWFTHKPLFVDATDEGDTGYWSVKPAARARLLALARRHDVAIVATGHLHRAHDNPLDGCRFIWGGSAGFLVGPGLQPPMPGDAALGAVLYDFAGSDVAIERVAVPGLSTFWIDDVIHEVYPPRIAA